MSQRNFFGGVDAQTGENVYALSERIGMNFIPESRELFDAQGNRCNGMFGIWRTDTNENIGAVGSRYSVLPYAAHFDFINSLGNDLILREAHVIDNGAQAYVYAWLNRESVEITPGDILRPAVMFRSSHDGSLKTCYDFIWTRSACKNVHGYGRTRGVKHTKNQTLRINLIRADLMKAAGMFDLLIPRLRALASCECNVDTMQEFVDFLFPPVDAAQKRAKTIRDSIVSQVLSNLSSASNNIGGMTGSLWQAYNALSEFVDHGARYNGTDDAKRDNRIKSIVSGRGADLKTKALDRLFAIAGV